MYEVGENTIFKVYCIHNEHAQYVLNANICKGTYKSKLLLFLQIFLEKA